MKKKTDGKITLLFNILLGISIDIEDKIDTYIVVYVDLAIESSLAVQTETKL